ncbi:uncharacterized protein LOC109610288 isoform X2 [Camponotus floridanus]|uniref:uncharacterized protein LOC109610288 isoform X2 n=1 Tax=Camponotus floridanus TaxID=104421 RepID=UPI000DC67C93|nr:uncharacterized protein LOC109610288 isoform X2 [Camponotus floridanus]
MNNMKGDYFSLNKILLLILGLWPYQQSNFARFQFILLSSILTTNVIFQYIILFLQRQTPNFTKDLGPIFMFTVFMIKYNMFSVKAVKDLMEQLLHVCNKLKDEKEIAIIDAYGCNVLAVLTISTFIVVSFWSNILNVFLSTNTSRSYNLIISKHLIDQEKYFYLILLHNIMSFSIGLTALLATGTMFFTYLQYVCGMFKIASYRIKQAMNVDMLRNHIFILKSLICAVNIHRQAIKLSKHLQYSCETMMFYLIAFGVGSLSLNLFRIASFEEGLILPTLYTVITILYMFLANYIGQIITNHNHYVFNTAYNVQWYIAPLHIQRIILFLLQRDSKNFTLSVGGLFVASVECFATLVKTSVSYFTVIYSTR